MTEKLPIRRKTLFNQSINQHLEKRSFAFEQRELLSLNNIQSSILYFGIFRVFSLIPLVLPQALVLPTVISKVLHEMLIQNTRKQNVSVHGKSINTHSLRWIHCHKALLRKNFDQYHNLT